MATNHFRSLLLLALVLSKLLLESWGARQGCLDEQGVHHQAGGYEPGYRLVWESGWRLALDHLILLGLEMLIAEP